MGISLINSVVDFNPIYIENHTVNINADHVSVDVLLHIAQDFKSDPWTIIGIYFKMSKNEHYRPIFHYDVNVCEILGRSGNNKIGMAHIWLNSFFKFGTLPKSCPIKKGIYHWNGIRTDHMTIPTILVNGTYKLLITTYFRKERVKRITKEPVANITILIEVNK
ncbi:uncharacterized protein LOC119686122 [Teleopsis dalmanni]|uniref:uncharacterized protein LOC119679626 n=1 Tax=Teleopsis dalmanni TaxID=139649 RepID=UPI0018CF600F|nr:uncharacterized protein LOC119679626 [Teleopsis dalmanni]XP_037956527.1 uncharacterized protein LOC119686122 [Teleopsis dalmanni]